MKLFTGILIALALFSTNSDAQNAQWAHAIKSQGYDESFHMVTDNGYVYICGQIEYLAAFDDGFTLESAGIHDIFVAKFDSLGNRIWAKRAGSRFGGEKAQGMAVDHAGNVYLCGEIDDTTYFDNIQVIGRPANNTFVCKYDPNGTILWVRHFETDSMNSRGYAISVDDAGNVYACGATQGNAYYNGTLLLGTHGDYDAYVFKFDTDGNFKWIQQIGGHESDKAYGVAVKDGYLYVTGYFVGTCHFPNNIDLHGYGGTDIFLAKFDTAGAIQWAKNYGDTGFDRGWDITINVNGNILCTGSIGGNANFGNNVYANSAGLGDMFLAAFNENGDALWAVRGGGPEDDIGRDVTHDRFGNIFVGGDYASYATFGPNTINSNGYADAFIVEYDSSATATKMLRSFGGPLTDRGRGVGTDYSGNVYFSGEFDTNISFDQYTLTGDSLLDIFLVKFGTGSGPACNASATATSSDVNCFGQCNGTASVIATGNAPFTYAWSNNEVSNNISSLCAGSYSVTITDAGGCTASTSVTVNQPQQLNTSAGVTQSNSCFGSCDATAEVTATGNGPFTYLWSTSPSQNTAIANGLCAGSYTVTVTDNNGCSTTESLAVNEPTQLVLTNAVIINNTCSGCHNGSIDIHITGGTTPYSYLWADGPQTQDRHNIAAGTYNVCVTDNNGCSVCDSYVVTEPTTGVDEITAEEMVVVYPNPFSETATISVSKDLQISGYILELFSYDGKLLRKIELTDFSTQISAGNLSKGIYFLKLTNVKTQNTEKIISLQIQ